MAVNDELNGERARELIALRAENERLGQTLAELEGTSGQSLVAEVQRLRAELDRMTADRDRLRCEGESVAKAERELAEANEREEIASQAFADLKAETDQRIASLEADLIEEQVKTNTARSLEARIAALEANLDRTEARQRDWESAHQAQKERADALEARLADSHALLTSAWAAVSPEEQPDLCRQIDEHLQGPCPPQCKALDEAYADRDKALDQLEQASDIEVDLRERVRALEAERDYLLLKDTFGCKKHEERIETLEGELAKERRRRDE